MTLITAILLVTLLTSLLIGRVKTDRKMWFALAGIGINAVATTLPALQALGGIPTEAMLGGNHITGPIPIRIDGLSAWFMLTIHLISLTGVLYGISYLKGYRATSGKTTLHACALVVLHASLTLLCVVQNSLIFLILWEMMAISAFILVIFENEKMATLKAGINYLIQSHISIVFLMTAFIWIAVQTGSYDFKSMGSYLTDKHPLTGYLLLMMLLVGFAFKAGFVPFHTWLPLAHPAAPAHVSGIMSGLIVKIGIFGILRMGLLLPAGHLPVGQTILMLSLATGIYGILNATVHRDYKRMLAYCTIDNIGIIGIGIGIGFIGLGTQSPTVCYLGFGGALLHVLNHAIFKSLLFMAAGNIYQQTHTLNMEHLGGLFRRMPQTGFIFLAGALAIGGIPPFSGFISEFCIYSGILEGFDHGNIALLSSYILAFGGLSLIGGLSVMTFTKSFGIIFLGTPRRALPHPVEESPLMMRVPLYILAAAMGLMMVFPHRLMELTGDITCALLPSHLPSIDMGSHQQTFIHIAWASAAFIVTGIVVWQLRRVITTRHPSKQSPTWGCAYTAPTSKCQYTGKSFAKPLAKHFNLILREHKRFRPLAEGERYPQESRHYMSHYSDAVQERVITPLNKRLLYAANYIKFIQNGKVQWYVLYGLLFIVLIVGIGWWQSLTTLFHEIITNHP